MGDDEPEVVDPRHPGAHDRLGLYAWISRQLKVPATPLGGLLMCLATTRDESQAAALAHDKTYLKPLVPMIEAECRKADPKTGRSVRPIDIDHAVELLPFLHIPAAVAEQLFPELVVARLSDYLVTHRPDPDPEEEPTVGDLLPDDEELPSSLLDSVEEMLERMGTPVDVLDDLLDQPLPRGHRAPATSPPAA